jgi:hypothetical protein
LNQDGTAQLSHHILPTSATMVGACVMVISIVRLTEITGNVSTTIDDMMALDGILFLASAMLSYMSLRSERKRQRLERYADLVFLGGLTLMVLASCLLAWEFGHSVVPRGRG